MYVLDPLGPTTLRTADAVQPGLPELLEQQPAPRSGRALARTLLTALGSARSARGD